MKTILLPIVSVALCWGCSPTPEDEFKNSIKSHVLSLDTQWGCWTTNGVTLKRLVSGFVEQTPFESVEMPFMSYVALRRSVDTQVARDVARTMNRPIGLSVWWSGVLHLRMKDSDWEKPNFGFTIFMITTNDQVQVMAFEACRNFNRWGGSMGRYYQSCEGHFDLLTWDGVMPNLNRPECLFAEQYKDIVAVLAEHLHNYNFFVTPDRLYASLEGVSPQRKFRLIKRTEREMVFVPEAVISCSE